MHHFRFRCQVFIKMQKLEQYQAKLEELTKRLADRTQNSEKPKNFPPCFISYSWVNSRQAVAKGTRYDIAIRLYSMY